MPSSLNASGRPSYPDKLSLWMGPLSRVAGCEINQSRDSAFTSAALLADAQTLVSTTIVGRQCDRIPEMKSIPTFSVCIWLHHFPENVVQTTVYMYCTHCCIILICLWLVIKTLRKCLLFYNKTNKGLLNYKKMTFVVVSFTSPHL